MTKRRAAAKAPRAACLAKVVALKRGLKVPSTLAVLLAWAVMIRVVLQTARAAAAAAAGMAAAAAATVWVAAAARATFCSSRLDPK
jgi:hypothetical protein